MLYRTQLRLLNSAILKQVYRRARGMLQRRSGADTYDSRLEELISEFAPGKSFADIGCMWGINGHYCFFAKDRGSSKVIGVDVMEPTEAFLKRNKECNSCVKFVRGDFHKTNVQEEVEKCDVLLCSGVFYHVPDPITTLRALRTMCSGTLILGTAIIPEMEVKNAAVFYPYLDRRERKLWNRHIGIQVGISGPYESQKGYDNWFWGMAPSTITSLLKIAGFEVVQQYITKFDGTFVCCATDVVTVSSDHVPFSSPLSEDFVSARIGDIKGRRLWSDKIEKTKISAV